mgnify:CR=1 FL=1
MTAPDPRKAWLVLVTVCFVIAGLALAWFSFERAFLGDRCWVNGHFYADGEGIEGYRDGKSCGCSNSAVICEDISSIDLDRELTPEDFTRDNLEFEARYITSGVSQALSQSTLNTSFKCIDTQKKGIVVVLEQAQRCTETMEAPIQIGMYHSSAKALTLSLVVNDVASVYTQPCTVEATFALSEFKYELGNDFALQYRSEDGQLVKANSCVYNSKLFNHEDRYEAIDGCNICRCDDGISKCSNDRVCN